MKVQVLRNVKWGEDIRLAGTVLDLPDAEAAEALRMTGVFVGVEAQAEAQARAAQAAAEAAPKRLLDHMALREQMRVGEVDRKAAESAVLQRNAAYHKDLASEGARQAAAVAAAHAERPPLAVVQPERPAPAAPAPQGQDVPPHKRPRKD